MQPIEFCVIVPLLIRIIDGLRCQRLVRRLLVLRGLVRLGLWMTTIVVALIAMSLPANDDSITFTRASMPLSTEASNVPMSTNKIIPR